YPSSAVLSRSRFFQRPFWHIAMPCGEDGNHPISIGYLAHTADTVELYLQESFIFRVLTSEAAVALD
ncbi:hypothetical protein CDI09_16835, partial [Komagataeibacter nataicola]